LIPNWLKTKLAATGNSAALIADYNQYAVSEAQITIGRVLRLIAGICARDQRQLIPQLLGRLMTNKAIIAAGFLDAARQSIAAPAILEQHSSLAPSGAEIARLETFRCSRSRRGCVRSLSSRKSFVDIPRSTPAFGARWNGGSATGAR
jgi:hypothetical protein